MPAQPLTETDLLHHGGVQGAWGSLGLWREPALDYHAACTALARLVGHAAGLQPGDRVLSVACGQGEELLLWSSQFGAAQVLGVEADAARAARATQRLAQGGTVRVGSGTELGALGLAGGSFDRVLCVDAAYHLAPRAAFLRGAFALLRPGGTLAYTDLVGDNRSRLLRGAARLCGLGADGLADEATQRQRLREAGFVAPQWQRLDEEVLDGFVRFVQRQSSDLPGGRWQAGWRRVAATAWLIPPCRAAGLGYALLAARRPGPRDRAAATASRRSATASAERTALSSSGTPASA